MGTDVWNLVEWHLNPDLPTPESLMPQLNIGVGIINYRQYSRLVPSYFYYQNPILIMQAPILP